MNKKIMLLALAAVSAVLALPAMASASEPLHLNPTPEGARAITGTGPAILSTPGPGAGGTTVTCDGSKLVPPVNTVTGTATFEAGGTTGNMSLTFTGDCKESVFGSTCKSTEPAAASGTIATTVLPFHLVTLANNKPGVLVTPNPGDPTKEPPIPAAFAHITCAGGLINFTVEGNGVIGTIENACGSTSEVAEIDFNATAHGVQEHVKVAGTETEFRLKKGGENAAQDTTGKVALGKPTKLECT